MDFEAQPYARRAKSQDQAALGNRDVLYADVSFWCLGVVVFGKTQDYLPVIRLSGLETVERTSLARGRSEISRSPHGERQGQQRMDWLGWTLTNSGRLKDGSEAFKKALAIAPENVSAQNGLGQCALGLGDLALAEESLKKSSDAMIKAVGGEEKITADSLPAAWYGLVNVYLLKDDFAQAKQWADRIAKVNPNDDTLKGMLKQIDKRDSSEDQKDVRSRQSK